MAETYATAVATSKLLDKYERPLRIDKTHDAYSIDAPDATALNFIKASGIIDPETATDTYYICFAEQAVLDALGVGDPVELFFILVVEHTTGEPTQWDVDFGPRSYESQGGVFAVATTDVDLSSTTNFTATYATTLTGSWFLLSEEVPV